MPSLPCSLASFAAFTLPLFLFLFWWPLVDCTYQRCFIGTEAVEWLLEHAFGDADDEVSRASAVALGQAMIENRLIEHVDRGKTPDFLDDYQFYRVAAGWVAAAAAGGAAAGAAAGGES